jgi:hypothetical protein
MRNLALVIAAGAALVAGTGLQARERLTGEEKLAKALEGRVAGEPVDCISLTSSRDTQVIDNTAIIYGSGRTIYVNRPAHPSSLDSDDVMVVNIHGSQLCKLDVVRMHDRGGGFYTGFVGLEQFVPYRRVASRD